MVMNRSGIATRKRFDGFLLAAMVAGCAPGAQAIEPEVLADYIAEGKAGTVFALAGGFVAWRAAGRPVAGGAR